MIWNSKHNEVFKFMQWIFAAKKENQFPGALHDIQFLPTPLTNHMTNPDMQHSQGGKSMVLNVFWTKHRKHFQRPKCNTGLCTESFFRLFSKCVFLRVHGSSPQK
jgi:hypothetical protein